MKGFIMFTHLNTPILEELNATTTEEGRKYRRENGTEYPSVTTVVGHEKKKFFAEWRRNNPQESMRVLRRGNSVHKLIEDYLNNEEIENPTGLFNQIKPYLDRHVNNILAQEVPLYSDLLRLAGRVDCIAEYDGKLSIIDFKGSTKEKSKSDIKEYFMQATAYAIMWRELTDQIIDQVVIMITTEEGSVQIFKDNPLNYVSLLKHTIDKYYAEKRDANEVIPNISE